MFSQEEVMRIKKEQHLRLSWFDGVRKPFVFVEYGVFPAVEYTPDFKLDILKWVKIFKGELGEKYYHVEVEYSKNKISFVMDLADFEDEQDAQSFLHILYKVEKQIEETVKMRRIIRG